MYWIEVQAHGASSDQSAPEILSALSVDAESLCNIAFIPDWRSAPLRDVADIHERMPVLLAVVNLTSQKLLHRDWLAMRNFGGYFVPVMDCISLH